MSLVSQAFDAQAMQASSRQWKDAYDDTMMTNPMDALVCKLLSLWRSQWKDVRPKCNATLLLEGRRFRQYFGGKMPRSFCPPCAKNPLLTACKARSIRHSIAAHACKTRSCLILLEFGTLVSLPLSERLGCKLKHKLQSSPGSAGMMQHPAANAA